MAEPIVTTPDRACTVCKETKPITEFGKNRRQCLACRRLYLRAHWKGYIRAKGETTRQQRNARDRYRYWIEKGQGNQSTYRHDATPIDYDGMLAKQGGKCAVCNSTEPKGLWNRFVMDHSHKTGRNRQLLCNHCNLALGLLKDDVGLIKNLVAYIERHS